MKCASLVTFLLLFSSSTGAINNGKKNAMSDEVNIVFNYNKNLPQSVLKDLDEFIRYVDRHNHLPKKYITKAKACLLNWSNKYCDSPQGACNLRAVAGSKKIGGDRFYGSKRNWPKDEYREVDIGDLLPNQCRNKYRLIYGKNFDNLYFSSNHYQSFIKLR